MAKNIRIFSSLDEKLIPLKECPYPIFASGAIGHGIAIKNPRHGIAIKNPTYGVFAPFSGVVKLLFSIGHAIGLKSNDGIEIFIQVGINDDELNCAEFKSEVKVDETVKPGQLLLKFSPAAIKKAVFNSMAVVVVTNHAEYETKFTILGESLSGKICYLPAMYSEMSRVINGYSIVAQDDRLDTELLESFENPDDLWTSTPANAFLLFSGFSTRTSMSDYKSHFRGNYSGAREVQILILNCNESEFNAAMKFCDEIKVLKVQSAD